MKTERYYITKPGHQQLYIDGFDGTNWEWTANRESAWQMRHEEACQRLQYVLAEPVNERACIQSVNKQKSRLLSIRCFWDDNTVTITAGNALVTDAEWKQYYEGKTFNVGDGPNDRMLKCIKIEIIRD